MNSNYPPKVLVRTWLQLIKADDLPQEHKYLIEQKIEKIFGSAELAEMYKDDVIVKS
tara:strand:+ start:10277 stop:10447 length:171 start_codon:yes stop_codon:yes gene_type:complete